MLDKSGYHSDTVIYTDENFVMDKNFQYQYRDPHVWNYGLHLLLADGTPTGGRGEDFLSRQPDFFTKTAVTPERKVKKLFPRWEINRHVEG